ncbi:peptidase inhibitor family I36 protein [Streptomyces sp. 900105755]
MKFRRVLTSAAAAAALVAVAAPVASADGIIINATNDHHCGNGFCLFYNSNQQGAYRGFTQSVASFADGSTFNKVGTSSAGYGQGVWNNAASASWRDSSSPCDGCINLGYSHARVYFNSNYMGSYDQIDKGYGGNLKNTYNENASLYMFN